MIYGSGTYLTLPTYARYVICTVTGPASIGHPQTIVLGWDGSIIFAKRYLTVLSRMDLRLAGKAIIIGGPAAALRTSLKPNYTTLIDTSSESSLSSGKA